MVMPYHHLLNYFRSVNESCDKINGLLKKQINSMSGPEGCKNGGEKCLYTVNTYIDCNGLCLNGALVHNKLIARAKPFYHYFYL